MAQREGWSLHRQNRLSLREFGILELLANGDSNEAIGRKVNLTRHSVENYVQEIYRKLGLEPHDPEVSPRVHAARHYWEGTHRGTGSRTIVIP